MSSSVDTYKGESPSKKLARFRYWITVLQYLGRDKFYSGKHLVLSSREGGDISVLLGMKVNPKNIVAVEMNVEAAAQAQTKFPDVKIHCNDVFVIAKKFHRELVSAFLDFCSPASDALIQKVIGVMAHGLKDGAILGCGFLAGREQGTYCEDVKYWRSEIDKVTETSINKLTDQSPDSVKEFIKQNSVLAESHVLISSEVQVPDKYLTDPSQFVSDAVDYLEDTLVLRTRANVLGGQFVSRGQSINCVPLAIKYLYYVSSTSWSKGVPMVIYMGHVFRNPGQSSKLNRRLHEFIREMPAPLMGIVKVDEDQLILDYLKMQRQFGTDTACMFLNVPKSSGAAWKAHCTRGTYNHLLSKLKPDEIGAILGSENESEPESEIESVDEFNDLDFEDFDEIDLDESTFVNS